MPYLENIWAIGLPVCNQVPCYENLPRRWLPDYHAKICSQSVTDSTDVFEVYYGSFPKASDDLKTSDDALETLYDLITKYTNFHEWCFKLFEVNMEYTPPQTLLGFTLSVTKSERKVQGNNV